MRMMQSIAAVCLMLARDHFGAEQANGKEFDGHIPIGQFGANRQRSGFVRRWGSGGSRKRRAARRFAQVRGRRMKCGR